MTTLCAVAPPMSWDDVEQATIDLVRAYSPDSLDAPQPFPIEDLIQFDLETLMDAVFRVEDLGHPFEAVTRWDPETNRFEIVFSERAYADLCRGFERARMTAAHELGHLRLHPKLIRRTHTDSGASGLFRMRDEVPRFQQPERQASVFAGRLLIPTSALRLAINHHGLNPIRLADIFQVSLPAMRVRLREFEGATKA